MTSRPLAPYRYAERTPSSAIAPWVLSLWSFQADALPPDAPPYTVFPDGCASVAINGAHRAPAMLVCAGPSLRATRPPVFSGQRLVGFRLWPDATEPVLGVSAPAMRDFLGPAPAEVLARFADLARDIPLGVDPDPSFDALDAALVRRLRSLPPPDPRVRAAVRAIVAARGECRVAIVAREAGVGVRHLQRRFPAATGLTLREYARVRRLREALAQRISSQPPGWSRIAAETGFVDHAHLTREFVSMTGVLPSVVARQLGRTAHDDVVP